MPVVFVEPRGQTDVLPADGVGEGFVQLGPVHQQELVVRHTESRCVEQLSGRVVEIHLAGFADGADVLADAELVEHGECVGSEPQPSDGGTDLRGSS